jgi:hypothetical protein
MGLAIIAAVGGAAVALLLVALVAALRVRNRTRTDLEAMLAAAQRESDDLRSRLEELTGSGTAAGRAAEAPAYLITDAGRSEVAIPGEDPVRVPDRLVLSATLGAPLVKVAAFSHGVRRALLCASRTRSGCGSRATVRASRKRRRQLVKEYQRGVRAEGRAKEGLG